MLGSHNWQIQSIPTPWTYVRDERLRLKGGLRLGLKALLYSLDGPTVEAAGYSLGLSQLQYTPGIECDEAGGVSVWLPRLIYSHP